MVVALSGRFLAAAQEGAWQHDQPTLVGLATTLPVKMSFGQDQTWRSGSGGRCAYQRPGLHETRPRARAGEFSSDSLSPGARLAGRSHGLTPGWFCWTPLLSECTSRITRRESFTPFDRVGLRAAGSGECHCCSAAGSTPRNAPATLILHPLRFGAFSIYLFTDSLCRSMR